VKGERVKTEVYTLDETTRVQELTEMLGAISDAGNQTARDLLAEADARKHALRQALAARKKAVKAGQTQEQQPLL
jgi:hypothetical protein